MYRALVIMLLLLFTHPGFSQSTLVIPGQHVDPHTNTTKKPASTPSAKPLDDSAMDRVTAAGVSATVSPQGVVSFSGEVPTRNGLVTSNGTLAVQTAPIITGTTIGTLSLSGNAQQNLSSIVNINAVNSEISVLLNLNINIDSTVGTITQSNLNTKH